MERIQKQRVVFAIGIALSVGLLGGCVNRGERTVTYEVNKSGDNWVENETIRESRDRHGHKKVETQTVYEKVKCENRKGQRIRAADPEECISLGGRVIDEVIVKEETVRKPLHRHHHRRSQY